MPRIELGADRRRLLCDVLVLHPDSGAEITGFRGIGLIDTGATVSGVGPEVIKALDLQSYGKRPLISARGVDQVERFLFRIAISPDDMPEDRPSFPFVFEPTLGFEITPGASYSALLGMDVLRHCDLELMRDGRCTLRFG